MARRERVVFTRTSGNLDVDNGGVTHTNDGVTSRPSRRRRTRTRARAMLARTSVASTSAFAPSRPTRASTHARGALVVVAASKKKDVRLQVTLECTEQKESGVMGMSRYMTEKVREVVRWVDVERCWALGGGGRGRRRERRGGWTGAISGFVRGARGLTTRFMST